MGGTIQVGAKTDHPHANPGIWVVRDDPNGPPAVPVNRHVHYIWARLQALECSPRGVAVHFYFCPASTGLRRNLAQPLGSSRVDLNTGGPEDVLCVQSWVPDLAIPQNESVHGCLIVEATHASVPQDPSPIFNASLPYIGQKNVDVLGIAVGSAIRLPFDVPIRKTTSTIAVVLGVESGRWYEQLVASLGLPNALATGNVIDTILLAHDGKQWQRVNQPYTIPRKGWLSHSLAVEFSAKRQFAGMQVVEVVERDLESHAPLGGMVFMLRAQ